MTSLTGNAPVAAVYDGIIDADNLTTNDPELVAEVLELNDEHAAGAVCQEVFNLGVAVRRLAQTDNEVARLEEQLGRFENQIRSLTDQATLQLQQQVEAAIDPARGAIPAAARDSSQVLQEAIKQALNANDRESAASQLLDAVQSQSQAELTGAVAQIRAMLDASREESPLGQLRRELLEGFASPLHQVTQQMTAVHALVVERRDLATTPADGLEYETVLGEVLNELSTTCGDVVKSTGTDRGIGESKMGDFVVEVCGPSGRTARFAVEAKDSKLGPKDMLVQLDGSAQNRDAVASILVMARDDYGYKKQPLIRMAPSRYVVVAERNDPSHLALRVAYQMARADALASLADDDGVELDLDDLRRRIDQALAQLTAVSTVKGSLTSAERAITKARSDLDAMKMGVEEILGGVTAAFSAINE
ncbi:hypothetical protein ASG76_02270 [Nocardioides sp. Soil774]|uniref:hypothetical protein n=1 Tax=Nocardioides sp. Soil774 TaxID=1736408 RepID=UPI0006F53048|nr:hypothetical protein [Nocardioides sp. Soil774]KRE97554.1 hypothetical protein ASG76_02270 [Nocardioides sp. Soil774]